MNNLFRQGLGLLSLLLLLAVSLLTAACGKSKAEQYADNQAKLRQMERTTDSLRYENSQLTGQQQQQQQYAAAEQQPTPPGQEYYDNERQQPQQQQQYYQQQHPSYSNGYGYNSQGFNNQGYDNSGHYSSNYDSDHRQEPYHQPSSQVGSHLAAAAVGAAVGGAAGYYAGNRRTKPAALASFVPQTAPTPSSNSKPDRFRSSLTKTYNSPPAVAPSNTSSLTRTYSTPAVSRPRPSIFSNNSSTSRPSSGSRTRSMFGTSSRNKRR